MQNVRLRARHWGNVRKKKQQNNKKTKKTRT